MPNLKNHTPENRSFALMREILCLKQKNEAKVFKRIVIQFRPLMQSVFYSAKLAIIGQNTLQIVYTDKFNFY